mgnify:CR=1 FL=1
MDTINTKELRIEGEVFENMRGRFNLVIQRLFNSMVESGAEDGSITLKVGVHLMSEKIPDTSWRNPEKERTIRVPIFDYKVSSQVAIKDEQKGNDAPQMELVYDEGVKQFVLKFISNTNQGTIWDDFDEPDPEEAEPEE